VRTLSPMVVAVALVASPVISLADYDCVASCQHGQEKTRCSDDERCDSRCDGGYPYAKCVLEKKAKKRAKKPEKKTEEKADAAK